MDLKDLKPIAEAKLHLHATPPNSYECCSQVDDCWELIVEFDDVPRSAHHLDVHMKIGKSKRED